MSPSSTPTASVGMPVYNGERYLGEAIASMRAQTGVDFEIVISDNASTDGTEEMCRAAAAEDDRIRYVRHTENRGAAWNFNESVRLSSGRYFTWTAHDDICRPTFLTECVDVLDSDPTVALAYPLAIEIDDLGEVIKEWPSMLYADQETAVARAWSALTTFTPCFETFGVVRREDLLATQMIGPYASSDRTLLFELALRGRFREIPQQLFVHRQHETRSVFTSGGTRGRDAWFDPDRAGLHTSPRWRLMTEHVNAIRDAPLSRREQAIVLAMLSRAAGRYARPLASETVQWALHGVRRSRRRSD